MPNSAVLDQGGGASAAAGRPLRHALRACGVGAGPSGRADRAAHRTKNQPQILSSVIRPGRSRVTGAGPPADSHSLALRVPSASDGSPAHEVTGAGSSASGGGASGSGMGATPGTGRLVVEVEAWSSRLPSSQDKPSRPGPRGEGRSSSGALHLHPWGLARSPEGGTTADGMTRPGGVRVEPRLMAPSLGESELLQARLQAVDGDLWAVHLLPICTSQA